MRILPPEKIREAVSLKLNGFSDREVARQSSISHTAVASSVRGFVKKVEEFGLTRASVDYSVADQINELQEIAQLKRKTNLTFDQAKKGFIWGKMLLSSGLNEEQIEDFSQKVLGECSDQKVSPTTIVSVCRSMSATRQRTGKGYEEIEHDVKILSESKSKLETDVATLEEREKEARARHKDILDKANVEEKAITQFVEVRDRLTLRGSQVDDINKLDNLLSNAEKLNYDVNKMISIYELNGDLTHKNFELSKNNDRLTIENTRLEGENRILDDEKKKKAELFGKVEDTEQAGITVSSISKIGHLIVRISAKHGISKSEAANIFVKDIEERYDEELSLKTNITRLQSMEKKLMDRNSQLIEDNRIQEEHFKDRKDEIEATNWLNKNGVTSKEITNLRREFQETKKGLLEIQSEFFELSKIPETLKKYDEHFKQLNKVRLEENAKNEQLKNERQSLEAANKVLEESYSKRVKEIEDRAVKSIQSSVNQVEWVGAELGKKAEKAIDDSALRIEKRIDTAGKALLQNEANLKNTVDKAIKDVESINAKAFSVGKATGAYEMLSIIHRLLQGEIIDKIIGGTSMLTMLRVLENYLKSQGATQSFQNIKLLQESVKNELIYRR
jgi:hypothetical protein